VQAYAVTIRNAAAPDKAGLLQPLLKRWQAGGLSYGAFALPAVQAVIGGWDEGWGCGLGVQSVPCEDCLVVYHPPATDHDGTMLLAASWTFPNHP